MLYVSFTMTGILNKKECFQTDAINFLEKNVFIFLSLVFIAVKL